MNKILFHYKVMAYSFCLISLLVQNMFETSSLGIISSTNEIIEIIDAGQRKNASLISPVKGEFTQRYLETPAGQQRYYEQMIAIGEEAAEEPPFVDDVINQFSSFIVFDGQKIKWATDDRKYVFNGKEAYEYVQGNNLSQAYIIDPKKIDERKRFADPRDWTYFGLLTLKEWLSNIKEDFEVDVEEVGESQEKRYIVRMNYANGFVCTMHIDPNRGWHILKAELVDNNNKLRSNFVLDVIKTPKGGWLAKKSVRGIYGTMDNTSDAVLLNSQEAILDKVSFEAIDPNEFTLNGLGVPSNIDIWDEFTDIIYDVGTYSSANMIPLVGNILPEMKDFGINFLPNDANEKMILLCFWNLEQRPSRNVVLQLSTKAEELKAQGVEIIAVQASNIEQATLDNWLEENNISFTVGTIQKNEEQTKFNWGVQSLPWLILTDAEHIVTYEGFSINELDEKLKK